MKNETIWYVTWSTHCNIQKKWRNFNINTAAFRGSPNKSNNILWNLLKYRKWYRITILESLKRQRASKREPGNSKQWATSAYVRCPGNVVEYCEIQRKKRLVNFPNSVPSKSKSPMKMNLELPRKYQDQNFSRNSSLESLRNYYVGAALWYYQTAGEEIWPGAYTIYARKTITDSKRKIRICWRINKTTTAIAPAK